MAKPDHTVLARPSVATEDDSTPRAHDPSQSADIAKSPLKCGQGNLDVVVAMFALARIVRVNNQCREALMQGRPMNAPSWPLLKEYADGLNQAIVHLSDYARLLGHGEWVDE